MRRCRKWVLTLGIMAAAPSVALADGRFSLPFLKSSSGSKAAAAPASRPSNQKVAEDIADALRKAKLDRHEIEIEYKDGTAVLSGKVADPAHRAQAAQLAARVSGVQRVDNRLTVVPAAAPARPAVQAAWEQARGAQSQRVQPVALSSVSPDADPGLATRPAAAAAPNAERHNQQMAERVAGALSEAGLNHFDIEVRYQNGTALLSGSVGTPTDRRKADQVVAAVPGVGHVDNRIMVRGQGPAGMPMAAVAYQPNGYEPPPGTPPVPAPLAPGLPPGVPMPPPGYVHPAAPPAPPAMYNMPHLPEYAWPTTAAYPNYAQVTYPTQYSASAWPYIGPFYPYPQVPLGWRQAQLEWDDGYWHLNFRPRTEKWFWFLNPKHW